MLPLQMNTLAIQRLAPTGGGGGGGKSFERAGSKFRNTGVNRLLFPCSPLLLCDKPHAFDPLMPTTR